MSVLLTNARFAYVCFNLLSFAFGRLNSVLVGFFRFYPLFNDIRKTHEATAHTRARARVVCALARSVSVSFSSSISSSISFSLRYPIGDHRVPIGGLFFIVPALTSSAASGLYLLFVIVHCFLVAVLILLQIFLALLVTFLRFYIF